jgi:hypothetical protein
MNPKTASLRPTELGLRRFWFDFGIILAIVEHPNIDGGTRKPDNPDFLGLDAVSLYAQWFYPLSSPSLSLSLFFFFFRLDI